MSIGEEMNSFNLSFDAIYIDQTNGYPGTLSMIGTQTQPVNNIADALTMAVARNIRLLRIIEGTFTLAAALAGYIVEGANFSDVSIDPGGFSIAGSTFKNLRLTGDCGSSAIVTDGCVHEDIEDFTGTIRNAILINDFIPGAGSTEVFNYFISDPTTGLVADVSALGIGGKLIFENGNGDLYIDGMTVAASVVIINHNGLVDLASNSAGIIKTYGDINPFTDDVSGATVTRYDIAGRTKGLDAIFQEVTTIEENFHTQAYTFPEDLSSPVNIPTLNEVKITAITGFGAWTLIATQAQLVTRFPNNKYYDPNLMMLIDGTLNRQWDFQVGCGANAGAVTIKGRGTFSTVGSADKNAPIPFRCDRIEQDGTNNLYMRAASNNIAVDDFDTRMEIHGPYTYS